MPTSDRIPRHFIGAVPDEWQLFSDTATDYDIGAPIGFGASSIVYQAVFKPPNAPYPVPCALKVLDLDRLPQHPLRLLQRETQLMSLSKHPNVLRVRGTWMTGHKLYIALRLMNAGSAADVMHYGWPGGMEEEVVKCVLKQALEGINYLHINGFIHRDVKAANLLIDDDGTVLLGDLGVAAFLGDGDDTTSQPKPSSSTQPPHRPPNVIGKRKSFVGTPCWMAPEVINRKQYDASADIWSFGITALELAQGRAPRSREPPHAVLLHIVTSTPPTLDRDAGPHKYSRAFQEIVERCLMKDPARRPSAAELLATPFFRNAKKKGYLVGTILKGLPPLAQRQERRKQPSILSPRTLDSWDFSSVTTSPTTSLYSPPGSGMYHRPRHPFEHTLSERLVVLEGEVANGEVVKAHGDGDGDEDASESGERAAGAPADVEQQAKGYRGTSQHAPRPHSAAHSHSHSHRQSGSGSGYSHSRSRGVSWADDDAGVVENGSVAGVVDGEKKGEKEDEVKESDDPSQSSTSTPPQAHDEPPHLTTNTPPSPPSPPPSTSTHTTPKPAQPLPVPVSKSRTALPPSDSQTSTTPPTKLWRRLIGKQDDAEGSGGNGGSGGESIRKRMLNGVLGVRKTSSTFGLSSSPSSD
ncbi:hypothetical protein EIP91_008844 [Steccherinum ochraceum]|uniref:Protein kinase domain-containing protein n=1 Tax=Steccherinum ochraceum TaxID=92696 RepID=A0A4R0R289_9APHY|nr:hypothetical protein EIP91_008844 [Steccherinum ochraceum]